MVFRPRPRYPSPTRMDRAPAAVLRALNYTAYLVVPLVAHGRTLDTISLVSSLVSAGSGRRYSSGDVTFAEDVAQRAALAVDNARLFSESEARRREAETLREVGQRPLGGAGSARQSVG
jgi:GAF domain-containing protein